MATESLDRPAMAEPGRSLLARFAPGLNSIVHLSPSHIPTEIGVGMAVAAIAVPGGLAMAQLMAVPAQIGLYACIVPALVYALIGSSSRYLIIGPDTATCIMMAATATAFGAVGPDARMAVISVLTLLVGVMCLVAYVARLGLVCTLVSRPVLLGYLAGVAATLMLDQLSPLTGIELESKGLVRPVIELFGRLAEINVITLSLGVGLFVLLRLMKRYVKAIPAPVVVIIIAVAVSWGMDLGGQGVHLVGAVPGGLPTFVIPKNPGHWDGMIQAAAGIMIISASSGILTARAFGQHVGERNDPNRELAGFGFANLAAALFQGFVVTGSDSRTAAAVTSGGRSALVGVVAATTVGLVALFLTGPIALLPNAALAAILISAAVDLVDIPGFRQLARISKFELLLAFIAIAGVIWVGVLEGVVIAVGVTLAQLVVMAARPGDRVMGLSQDGEALVTTRRDPDARQAKGILVYLFESSLFFVNTEYFADRVRVALENAPGTRYLVLNTSLMMYADSMAVAVLIELAEEMEESGIVMLLGGGHGRFHEVLYSSGLADKIGRDRIFTTPEEAFDAAKEMRNASGDANVEQRGSLLGEAPA